jgi:hypothetical protein
VVRTDAFTMNEPLNEGERPALAEEVAMSVARSLRRPLALGLVGVAVGGLALMLHGGVGRAADDAGVLDFLRTEAARLVRTPEAPRPGFVALPPAGRGFTALSGPSRPASPRRAVAASSSSPASDVPATVPQRTVCVRTCDGFLFPLGNLAARADLPAHQAGCAAACPGAATALYTLPAGGTDLTRATSLAGQPYARLATAGLYRKGPVAACSCSASTIAQTPILRDPTLRAGDVVARADGAGTGASAVMGEGGERRLVEFRRPGALAPRIRREVDRLTGTSRREFAEAQFRREMVVRHALAARPEAARIRLAAVGGFEVLAAPAGFRPVRVVAPSPYVLR